VEPGNALFYRSERRLDQRCAMRAGDGPRQLQSRATSVCVAYRIAQRERGRTPATPGRLPDLHGRAHHHATRAGIAPGNAFTAKSQLVLLGDRATRARIAFRQFRQSVLRQPIDVVHFATRTEVVPGYGIVVTMISAA
jgi:hypothetical protein